MWFTKAAALVIFHDENAVALWMKKNPSLREGSGVGAKKRGGRCLPESHTIKNINTQKLLIYFSNYEAKTHITMQKNSERMYATSWMMAAMMRSSSVSPR